jgi:hypothetical protein
VWAFGHQSLSISTECSPGGWRHASKLQEHQNRCPPLLTDSARTPRECNRPTPLVAMVDVCYRCKDSKAATSCKGITLRRVQRERADHGQSRACNSRFLRWKPRLDAAWSTNPSRCWRVCDTDCVGAVDATVVLGHGWPEACIIGRIRKDDEDC